MDSRTVEQCNDYSQWPYSRLRVASYAAPAFRPSSPSPMPSLPSQPSPSTHPNLYEASLIAALRRDLHAEKSAHEETRHRLTLRISTLEAQLAFREAELEGCAARIGSKLAIADSRCRNCQHLLKADAAVHQQSADTNKPSGVSNGGNHHYDYDTPDTVLRVLDAARAKSRSLEQDIKDITAKVCLPSSYVLPFSAILPSCPFPVLSPFSYPCNILCLIVSATPFSSHLESLFLPCWLSFYFSPVLITLCYM